MFKISKAMLISLFLLMVLSASSFMLFQIYSSKTVQTNLLKQTLLQESEALFSNIKAVKEWNESHLEVLVKRVDNSYEETNSYKMIRELAKFYNKNDNYYLKITSLKPMNPNNQPDSLKKRH